MSWQSVYPDVHHEKSAPEDQSCPKSRQCMADLMRLTAKVNALEERVDRAMALISTKVTRPGAANYGRSEPLILPPCDKDGNCVG